MQPKSTNVQLTCRNYQMRIKDLPYDQQLKAEKLAQNYVDNECKSLADHADAALMELASVRARIDELQAQKLQAAQATKDWCKVIAIELINAGRNGSSSQSGLYDAKAVSSGIKLLLDIDAAEREHPLISIELNSNIDAKVDELIKLYAMPY